MYLQHENNRFQLLILPIWLNPARSETCAKSANVFIVLNKREITLGEVTGVIDPLKQSMFTPLNNQPIFRTKKYVSDFYFFRDPF